MEATRQVGKEVITDYFKNNKMVVKGIRINILNASFFYEVRSITKFDVYIFMYLSLTVVSRLRLYSILIYATSFLIFKKRGNEMKKSVLFLKCTII